MEERKALFILSRKLHLFPNDCSSDDIAEIERLKSLVYSSTIDNNEWLSSTPPSESSSTSSSSNSIQSEYTKNVISNRFFKNQFENVTFESISPFLDDARNHLQTTANFHAMFVNFIRFSYLNKPVLVVLTDII